MDPQRQLILKTKERNKEGTEEIDRELEETSSDLINKIESLDEKFRLYRSIYRKLHVDQIVKRLNGRRRT